MWDIEVTLDDNPYPLRLCRCLTPDVAGAIVEALCRASETRPVTVRRVEGAPPPDPPGYDAFRSGG